MDISRAEEGLAITSRLRASAHQMLSPESLKKVCREPHITESEWRAVAEGMIQLADELEALVMIESDGIVI